MTFLLQYKEFVSGDGKKFNLTEDYLKYDFLIF